MNTYIIIIGIILIVLSALVFGYSKVTEDEDLGGLIEDEEIDYPYRNFAFPTFIGGIVLVIAGLFIPSKN